MVGSTPRSKAPDLTEAGDPNRTAAESTSELRSVDLAEGDPVGDYRIERKLGHGGMGAVYAAVHPIIDKRVAIKVLRPELSDSDEAVARFVQEARAVNRIRHPSIVDVFGYGTTTDGRCFLVMELLDGESLGARLENNPPTIGEACDVLIEITHALDAAHASGIVHRDLKPDNVFLVEGNRVKLLDFGIAKLTEPSERAPADYTQPGQAMGTPRYIAPEQARGEAVDGRTDIYSLGVMAFELLTGQLPFVSDNAMELVAKHITTAPPAPTEIAPTLPPVADVLLLEMLAKDPQDRPSLARVRALLDELRAPRVTYVGSTAPSARPAVEVSTRDLAAQQRRRPRWLIPAAIAGMLGAAALSWSLISRDDSTPSAPPIVAPVPPVAPPHVEVTPKPEPVVTKPEPEPVATPEPPPVPPPVKRRPANKRVERRVPVAEPAKTVKPDPPAVPVAPPPPPPPPPPKVDDPDALKKPKFERKTP